MFERALSDVRRRLEAAGLSCLLDTVSRIREVRQESFHDLRDRSIGLNLADVKKPYAAFHNRRYLIVHELGHHFAEVFLGGAGRHAVRPAFGDYDAPYRRLPRPRTADADHVSRYAMTHPAEDFAETFAVTLWQLWDPHGVRALLSGKSALCRAKVTEMGRLIEVQRLRGKPGLLRPIRPGRAPKRA